MGHGITLINHQDLVERVVKEKVAIECCLTSNVGWKVKSYDVHPIKQMFEAGVIVSLNSDNTLLSGNLEYEASPNNGFYFILFFFFFFF